MSYIKMSFFFYQFPLSVLIGQMELKKENIRAPDDWKKMVKAQKDKLKR